MHLLQSVVNGIALLSVGVVSHPLDSGDVFQALVQRAESPDNTCGLTGSGNNLGYTCPTTSPCCSQNVNRYTENVFFELQISDLLQPGLVWVRYKLLRDGMPISIWGKAMHINIDGI